MRLCRRGFHHFLLIGSLCVIILSAGAVSSCTVFGVVVLDNRDHGLPCDQLPTVEEVTQALDRHQSVIQQILDVHPGQVFVDIDRESCPGHADIVISYASHQDRVQIETIIAGDAFFGVPYKLRNQ